jgi:hypothetical protein
VFRFIRIIRNGLAGGPKIIRIACVLGSRR